MRPSVEACVRVHATKSVCIRDGSMDVVFLVDVGFRFFQVGVCFGLGFLN